MQPELTSRYAPAAVVLHHRVLAASGHRQGIRAGVNQRNGGKKQRMKKPHMVAVLSGRAAQVQ